MHGLKSAILAFFQKSTNWLEWSLVTTIDLKYNAFRWSSGIIRQLEMSLKFGIRFVHIQAKSRAIEAKKSKA